MKTIPAQGVRYQTNRYYCGMKEVMDILGCKEDKAYRLIRSLRKELIDSGRLTAEYPSGKIPRKYLMERLMIE